MTVLDASAVMAALMGEPAQPDVQALLARGDSLMTALGIAETIDHLVRVAGVGKERATIDVAGLGLDAPARVDEALATAAGLLRARRYHRTRASVSLADCVAAEAARGLGVPLATTDPALLAVCHAEGIEYFVLPQSDGTRWSPPDSGPPHRG